MSKLPYKPPNYGNGKYILELFPLEMIDLNKELCSGYHPKLEAILGAYPANETDIKFAQIASYCQVVLDGIYTFEDKMKLARILTEKLILLREDPEASKILLLT